MNEARVTVTGNVAVDPVLRETPQGVRVTGFRLAHTPRRLDRATGAWSDGSTVWFGVTCWRALAVNAQASLSKGDRVVVSGRLTLREWTSPDGERRSALEIDADSLGLDLSFFPARSQRPRDVDASRDPGPMAAGLPGPREGQDQVDHLAGGVSDDDAPEEDPEAALLAAT